MPRVIMAPTSPPATPPPHKEMGPATHSVRLLVATAVRLGRENRPDLHLGVCGEHGGDPQSIHFFERVGLDYVSCSPFRVPIARLEAARARV